MNLLGKAFTVLILLMSIAFMMLAVTVYATHRSWREDALKYKQQVDQATQENIRLREERDNSVSKLAMEQTARRYAIASLQSRLEQVEDQLSRREEQYLKLQATETVTAETLRTTENNLAKLTTEVERLRNDIKSAQDNRDKSVNELVALQEMLNSTEGILQTEKEKYAALREENESRKKVMDRLNVTVNTPVDGIPPKVDGFVTAVSRNDLLEISIGADDGLREGHMLDVYRDATYLGRIIVRKTQPDRAVAEVIKEYRKGTIKKGDRVATKLI